MSFRHSERALISILPAYAILSRLICERKEEEAVHEITDIFMNNRNAQACPSEEGISAQRNKVMEWRTENVILESATPAAHLLMDLYLDAAANIPDNLRDKPVIKGWTVR